MNTVDCVEKKPAGMLRVNIGLACSFFLKAHDVNTRDTSAFSFLS